MHIDNSIMFNKIFPFFTQKTKYQLNIYYLMVKNKVIIIALIVSIIVIASGLFINAHFNIRMFGQGITVYDVYPDGQRYVHKPPTFKFKIHSNADRRIIANILYSTDKGIFNKSLFFGINAGDTIRVEYSPSEDGHNGTEFDTFLKKYKWTVVIYNYTINGIGEILWQKANNC